MKSKSMLMSKTKNRSGITLLFVISMIVLFLLMGASFVIMSTQFRRSQADHARIQTHRDDARTLVSRAFYDIFRGPTLDNVFSPLRGHSILADQYGYGVKAYIRTVAYVGGTNNQLLVLELDSAPDVADPTAPGPVIPGHQYFETFTLDNDYLSPANHASFSDQGGAYDGQVLTFVTGPGTGISARIVSYVVSLDANGNVLNRQFVLMPQWDDQDSAFAAANIGNLVSSQVLINGREFAGTGAGFYTQPTVFDNAALSAQALLPNRVGESRSAFLSTYMGQNIDGIPFVNPLAPNESYDAIDFQNMFLAAIRDENADGIIDPMGIVPSFHNLSLINYHTANSPPDERKQIFRVTAASNNGNANFPTATVDAAPEVDNDLDGVNDGVWLDIGLPLQTDMRGRVYKPLVSYLVIDMDGKFNVNAHGNESDIDPVTGAAYVSARAPLLGGVTGSHRGQGYGPPEINIGNLFGIVPGSDYELLLRGGATAFTGGVTIPGRYGVDGVPGGLDRDAASINKWYSHPTGTLGGYFGSPMDAIGRFGTGVADFAPGFLSDPYDSTSTIVNVPYGMPIIDPITSSWSTTPGLGLGTEIANAPYEMSFRDDSLMPAGSADTPFSPREMERVLRLYDPDAVMLPSRLRDFTRTTLAASPTARMAFTTASNEVPVVPENMVALLRQTLMDVNGIDTDDDNVADAVEDNVFLAFQVGTMLSPELVKGLRMDVNRPFGNGADDDGDFVVDESWHPDATGFLDPALNESQTPGGEPLFQADSTTSTAATVFDHDNDGIAVADPDAHLVHQYFARHLYILTLLATERIDRDGDGAITPMGDWYDYNNDGNTDADDWVAYRLDVAQWAINVANFRDPDAIRQPFEVDLEPWDGWHVNGILNDDELADPMDPPSFDYYGSGAGTNLEDAATKTILWGVERPEMLMTEVWAAHDRRTQDLNTDDGARDFTPASGGADPTLDSALVPNASFFLELYNPWVVSNNAAVNSNNLIFPAEMYDAGATGIDLQRTAPDGSPVWQVMVIHTDTDHATNPQNPDLGFVAGEDQILRRIYFVKPDPTVNALEFGTNKVYFPESTVATSPLVPGGYAVAGSSGVQDGDRYHTYLGRRTTLTWDTELEDGTDETRRITLDTDAEAVEINYFDSAGAGSWNVLTRPAVVIPIGRQEDGSATGKVRSLGVTDPTNGYDVELTAAGLGYQLQAIADGFRLVDAVGTPVVHDEPLDSAYGLDFDPTGAGSAPAAEWAELAENGMHNDDQLLRVVHLRCLANPLAPYDPLLNPYLTVDSLGVPVSTFNGAAADDEFIAGAAATDENTAFETRERGVNEAGNNRERLLWRADQNGTATPFDPPRTNLADSHFVALNLNNSFAELNVAHRTAVNPTTLAASIQAFPWLSWNNRPFVSHLELANVPFTNSFFLLSRMDYEAGVFGEYDTFATATGDPNRDVFAGRFKHLPGFHADADESPRLHRVMDYLEVPSRFVGTETYLNPTVFGAGGTGSGLGFEPPFNKISNYRYPGKINLNTIFDPRVWNGLMRNYNLDVDYATFDAARKGTVGALTDYPTEFAAPFRATRSANLVPTLGTANPNALVAGRSDVGNTEVLGSETGLYRRDLPTGTNPLLDVYVNPADPTEARHANPDRNAYFRNDMRQRLGNLVTNRSSVFSIWITIGFFEVDENLQIGAEVGTEEGEVQRYRGFYMVDRSIPVGFEPGFNHNVDQAILTSSITERAIRKD